MRSKVYVIRARFVSNLEVLETEDGLKPEADNQLSNDSR